MFQQKDMFGSEVPKRVRYI